MSTYYVKKTGNDSLAGTSESQAWLTVTKAFQTAVAGDTVYIAPGIYREKPTVSNAGTSGSPIKFIGDPDCVNFTNEKKGIVRITGAGTDEKATTGVVISCSKNYIEFHYLNVDGSLNNTLISSSSGYNPLVKNCFLQNGYNGADYCVVEDTIVIGAYWALRYCAAERVVAYNRNGGFYYCTSCKSCISIGGSGYGFYYCTGVINSSAYFTSTGIRSTGNTINVVNFLAFGCITAFYAGKLFNCTSASCVTAFSGLVANDCYYFNTNTLTSGTVTTDSGYASPVEVGGLLHNFLQSDVLKLFLPYLMTAVLNKGTSSQGTPPTYDALNLTLQQGNGVTPPIGAFGAHAYTLDQATPYSVGPSIDFTTKGEKVFTFFAKGGVAFTKKVWAKYSPGSEDEDYAQLIARGKFITTQTATGTTVNTWEQLSVSATPTKDCVIELIIKSRGGNTNDVTKFSDFS